MKLDLYHIKKLSQNYLLPNIKPKTVKSLEENKGVNLHDIRFGNDFLDMTPKARKQTKKNRQIGLHQILKFCTSKDSIHRVKMQPTE